MTPGALDNQRGAEEASEESPYFWPVWEFDSGWAALSRYVAPNALPREAELTVGLTVEEEETLPREGQDKLLTQRLYERFLAKKIGYGREPWASREGVQQIRHPWWLFEDRHGTCIDLATTFAAMCLNAHLRTLLVLTETHALVAVRPGWSSAEPPPPGLAHPGFCEVEPGVKEGSAAALQDVIAQGLLVALDVVAVTNLAGYEQACAAARSRLDEERSANRPVWLVDVAFVQGHVGYGELDPPSASRPSIRMRVPAGESVKKFFPTQREVIARVQGGEGIFALIAKSGRGKSVLARHLAEHARFGAAWFLDASDRNALLNSLAMAMQVDMGRPEREVPEAERKALADTALARLRTSNGPWFVVFDNADGDPAKIRDLVPVPKRGQQLLITSTNEEWVPFLDRGSYPQWEAIPLSPVDTQTVDRFGGETIAELVEGRPLLIEAFSNLDPDADWATRTIPPAPPDLAPELRGPAVYWKLLRSHTDFGQAALEVAALAAFMPPNAQPLSVLSELVESGGDAVEFLHDRGLLTIDRNLGMAHMHRLFGAAVREDLEASEGPLCDRLVGLLTRDERARAALDEYGDWETVDRLDERLMAIDERTNPVDRNLGLSLHGVGMLLELHGHTRRSGQTFERAERHLMDDSSLRADCLLGRARTVNQHKKKEEKLLEEAIGWSREARELKDEAGEKGPAYRALAMEGLLMRPLAKFRKAGEPRNQLLDEAQAILEEADDARQQLSDEEVPPAEKARSRYNLAGVRIPKAKESPARAAEHLKIAERIYSEVADWRNEIYGRMVHPHIAACINGLAIVAYYRAMLLPADEIQRSTWLRYATEKVDEALKQRELLDGSADGDEASKSAALLAKIALARSAPPPDKTPDDAADMADEAMGELEGSDRLPPPAPAFPSGRRGLRASIDGWARSPALLEVVGTFGQLPPEDLELPELLAWLDRFSDRWDFRQGERDIGDSPQFTGATKKAVEIGASALGLVASGSEPQGHFDLVLILGGLARAAISRPRFTAEAIAKDGGMEAHRIVAIGAFRDLSAGELKLLESFGETSARDELAAMDFGVRSAFKLRETKEPTGEDLENPNASWRVCHYETETGMPVQVAAAPSSDPDRGRANTGDALSWLAETQLELKAGQRLLVVTTDIYVPYQHAVALRQLALPYGVDVEMTGVVPGLVDPALAHEFAPDKFLQEIRSTIRALRELEVALSFEE